jgi:hypothetical protein
MPWEGPPDAGEGTGTGMAGGPGPTPPGLDDGTPVVVPAQPETPAAREAGAERQRGDPEEPDPS